MKEIFIVTGPIQSGKTTRLEEWVKSQNNIDGILQPIINGTRCLKNISSGESNQLELAEEINDGNLIRVGKFVFDEDVFKWAQKKLLLSIENNLDWLVIDEYGKLELIGKGLEPIISEIILDEKRFFKTKLVVVIRDYLLDEFVYKFRSEKVNIELMKL